MAGAANQRLIASSRTPKMLRTLSVEFRKQVHFRLAIGVRDRLQANEQRAGGEVRTGDNIADAVEDDRPRGVEHHFVGVGEERTHRESAAARQPA